MKKKNIQKQLNIVEEVVYRNVSAVNHFLNLIIELKVEFYDQMLIK